MSEEHVEALLENVNGLVAQLVEVYAVASAYAADELHDQTSYEVLERTRLVLKEHGVEV